MAFVVAGPHRQRGGAVVAGEGVLGLEPARRRRSRRRSWPRSAAPTPTMREQASGRASVTRLGDLALECSISTVRSPACARPGLGAIRATSPSTPSRRAGDGVEVLVARISDAGRRIPARVELVEMPAQPVDVAGCAPRRGPRGDRPAGAALAAGPSRRAQRQVRLAQRRPSHRQRVDRIGLAVGARRVAGVGHQLRRHPHDPLAGREQVGLEPPRQMPAVLHRPRAARPRTARPTATAPDDPPSWSPSSSSCRAGGRPRRPPPPCGCACAHRSPRSPWSVSPFTSRDDNGTGRWAHLSGGDATLLSSHAGRFSHVRGPAKRTLPTKGTRR